MKDEFVNKVCGFMASAVDETQLSYLRNVLYAKLAEYEIRTSKNEVALYTEDGDVVKMFLLSKKIDGLSDRSLKTYNDVLKTQLHRYIQKPVLQFTKDDLRMHFARRMLDSPNLSKTYINHERRVFSTFFNWLNINGYVNGNPMSAVKIMKEDYVLKEPFEEREINKMRDWLVEDTTKKHKTKAQDYASIRNLAIFEFLLSTGCRVSELSGAKLKDLDLRNKECKVFGKGAKERICYLNDITVMRLEHWLRVRGEDDVPYIFINCNGSKSQYKVSGVEIMIRKLGKELGINAHPHKFRRTCATTLLNKGMPIEQVQIILGHNQLDTTLIYARTNNKTVKMNHEKYI